MEKFILIIFFFLSSLAFSQEENIENLTTEITQEFAYISGDQIIWEGVDLFGAEVKVIYNRYPKEKVYVERITKVQKFYAYYKNGKVQSKGILLLQEEKDLEVYNISR